MRPYNKGIFQNIALWNNTVGIWHLLKAVGPLLLGTVLEYGEWELLTVFVSWLGPAEGKDFIYSLVYSLIGSIHQQRLGKRSNIRSYLILVFLFFAKLRHGLCWGHYGIFSKL
mmetsp:Transcript_6151/g.17483  ORF Transcript_6151/g.17483 Transcript_6151/m.17483 type:complete len:113 (+) Transcript_6151:1674-2012(+)